MPVSRNVKLSVVPSILQAELAKREMTVTDAAALVGLTRPVFSQILHGRYAVSVPTAHLIEAAFGLKARRLLILQLDQLIAQHHEMLHR